MTIGDIRLIYLIVIWNFNKTFFSIFVSNILRSQTFSALQTIIMETSYTFTTVLRRCFYFNVLMKTLIVVVDNLFGIKSLLCFAIIATNFQFNCRINNLICR